MKLLRTVQNTNLVEEDQYYIQFVKNIEMIGKQARKCCSKRQCFCRDSDTFN